MVNIALDGALAAVAAPIARWIAQPQGGLYHPLWFLASGGITLLLGGLPFRLSQQYWRFSGLSDLAGVMGGSIACAALFAGLLLATGFALPTATFPIVHAMTLMVLLGVPRLGYRMYRARPHRIAGDAPLQRVLLVGAGDAADAFFRAAAAEPGGMRIVGLLALADRQAGRRMHGVPIMGTAAEADEILDRLAGNRRLPSVVIVTEADFLGPPLAALIAAAERHNLPVRRAPRPTALTDAGTIELRRVAIEDLLNRPPVTLDRGGMRRLIEGRRVLLTGVGGSIGSELARQIAALGPAHLVLLDQSEYALWQIDLEIAELQPALSRSAVIADVRDRTRIGAVFDLAAPELVFHAAALKHVPIVEANPIEGLLTNTLGTRIVADAARLAGARAMVLISTDKAVNPTSVMGGSKRAAEMYCQALDEVAQAKGGMRCVTVRFGNVLGSTGSVVPLFRRQLERGGPLTVTHPDMQRYFMTVPEAVSLVLEACVLRLEGQAGGGKDSRIFVLDMGKPVKIVDLARQMIRLAGYQPDRDICIEFTGLRPGEKLYEELFHGREAPVPTGNPGLLIAAPRLVDLDRVSALVDAIASRCLAGDVPGALAHMRELVPEFAAEGPDLQAPETPEAAASTPLPKAPGASTMEKLDQ